MSGIAQAGLIFLIIIALMILSARDQETGSQIRDDDEDTCGVANCTDDTLKGGDLKAGYFIAVNRQIGAQRAIQ